MLKLLNLRIKCKLLPFLRIRRQAILKIQGDMENVEETEKARNAETRLLIAEINTEIDGLADKKGERSMLLKSKKAYCRVEKQQKQMGVGV